MQWNINKQKILLSIKREKNIVGLCVHIYNLCKKKKMKNIKIGIKSPFNMAVAREVLALGRNTKNFFFFFHLPPLRNSKPYSMH